jgi:two-component system, NtrC family, sensor histidine kinase HydH
MFNSLDVLTSGGTVRVGATVVRGEPGGPPVVLIRIADTGPGLPAGLEGRIFDPFVSTKETGLGLGLSISKRIVEAHGGSITATNSPADGAVFTVRLPAARAAVLADNGVLASHGAR